MPVPFNELISPNQLDVSLALIIGIFMCTTAFMGYKLRSAAIIVSLCLSGIVFILTVLIGLSFIWFWLVILLTFIVIMLSSIERYFLREVLDN